MAEIRLSEETRAGRLYKPVSKSDFFPKLIGLQKFAQARSAAILKIRTSGLPNQRKLYSVLDSFPAESPDAVAQILETYGQAMTEHIEHSTLPLMFNGAADDQSSETVDFSLFTVRLKGRILPFSGVAFPVRLGSMGNGYMVFAAKYFDMNSDAIIDIHLRCHQLMKDLLSLDERRSTPSEVLSIREIACLQMAGDGMISEQIATQLGLSVHTVNAYLSTATTKLDSVNRIQAIAKALRLGFIA